MRPARRIVPATIRVPPFDFHPDRGDLGKGTRKIQQGATARQDRARQDRDAGGGDMLACSRSGGSQEWRKKSCKKTAKKVKKELKRTAQHAHRRHVRGAA